MAAFALKAARSIMAELDSTGWVRPSGLAHLPLPVFHHILLTMSSERLEVSPCGLDLSLAEYSMVVGFGVSSCEATLPRSPRHLALASSSPNRARCVSNWGKEGAVVGAGGGILGAVSTL